MATPTTSTYNYPLPLRAIADRYPAGDGDGYDRLAAFWSVVFYGAYGLFVGGWLPGSDLPRLGEELQRAS